MILNKNQAKKRLQSYQTFHKLNKISDYVDQKNSLFSIEPTNYLVLTNIGYGGVGGIKPQELNNILANLEINEFELICKNGKPFSYLIFKDIQNSIISYKKLNLIELKEMNKLIYCEYLKFNPIKLSNTNDKQDNINGLNLINDFLTIEEELELVESIESDATNNWSTVQNRFVKHYGFKFDYDTNSFGSTNNEMPIWSKKLLQKLYKITGDSEVINMDQVTVSKYPKGTGIPPHVDAHTPFGHTILSISLLTSTQMEFTNPKSKLQYSTMLNPRSALVMSGESRYGWEHCIKERKFDLNDKGELVDRGERISLTYRRTNPTLDCNCQFEYLCNRN